jgi:D-alanine-D-alanine ligase
MTGPTTTPKNTVGVFFGGRSPEHDVSIVTGELIISGLKKLGYPVVPVYIGQNGEWHVGEKLGELKFFSAGDYRDKLKGLDALSFDLESSRGKIVMKSKGWGGKTSSIDIAFPAMHGQYGEDGTLQGLFEMLNVPYVGCDVSSSALAMDKVLTKLMYRAEGIPTTAFVSLSASEWEADRSAALKSASALSYPLFVKPARLGSSIGISKARDAKELEFGIEVAFHYDNKVIIEEGIEPVMDVTACVIGHTALSVSLLQESSFAKDFFSYEDKYLNDGGAQLGNAKKSIVIPASLGRKKRRKSVPPR